MNLTDEQRAVLAQIAEAERKLLSPTADYLARKRIRARMPEYTALMARRRLMAKGLVEAVPTAFNEASAYRLTLAGWGVAGNPPLHLAHPGTQEARA